MIRKLKRTTMIALAAAIFMQMLASPTNPASAVSLKGKVEVKGTVTIDPSIPQSVAIIASVNASISGPASGGNPGGFADASAATSVTLKRSGSSAGYDVVLPYAWAVENPQSMVVTINLSANSPISRYVTIGVFLPIPANGATTVVNLPAAI